MEEIEDEDKDEDEDEDKDEDENSLISITELPVGRWTGEYTKFLMAAASQDGKDQTPFIEVN